MRLFVAVDIDDDTRAQVRAVREAIQTIIAHAPVPPRVTWVKDDLAHVTLQFIGEVAEDLGAALEAALATELEVHPFDVRWEHLGIFPEGRSPRAIWMGASSGQDRLAALASLVRARLGHLVGSGEPKPFKAHLTVGRVKHPGRGVDWAEVIARCRFTPITTRVDHVTLYRSRLSSRGPTYTEMIRASMR